MYSYIARQPILNNKMQTVAYELLFRDGMNNVFPDVSPEHATTRIISDQLLCIPILRITDNHRLFINVPHRMIINGLGDTLPNDKVVIEILEDAIPDDELFRAIRELHGRGYQFALDDFTLDSAWDRFLKYISVIKFDIREKTYDEIAGYLREKRHLFHCIKFLAEKVETNEEFERYRQAGFVLFQGFFFSKPEILRNKCLSQNAVALSSMMMEVSKDNPDITVLERLLKNDLTLSYKLMRYVRNILVKSHGITPPEVLTLKEMLMYLGRNEIRRFVSVAALSSIGISSVSELYHLSMVRGKFCELIAEKLNHGSLSYNAFVCGLFSLLDVILEQPMDDLMQEISVPDNVTDALCRHEGELFEILDLSVCYEKFCWEEAARIRGLLNISESNVIAAMQTATKWADELTGR